MARENELDGDLNDLFPANIKHLDVSSNFFSSSISDQFFLKLTGLESLEVANNALTGTIPESILELTSLQKLRLRENDFTGTMPSISASIDSDVQPGELFGTFSPTGSPSASPSFQPTTKPTSSPTKSPTARRPRSSA